MVHFEHRILSHEVHISRSHLIVARSHSRACYSFAITHQSPFVKPHRAPLIAPQEHLHHSRKTRITYITLSSRLQQTGCLMVIVNSNGLSTHFAETRSHKSETLLGKPQPQSSPATKMSQNSRDEDACTRRSNDHTTHEHHRGCSPLQRHYQQNKKHQYAQAMKKSQKSRDEDSRTRRSNNHTTHERCLELTHSAIVAAIVAKHGPPMLSSSKVHCWLCRRRQYTLGSVQIAVLPLVTAMTRQNPAIFSVRFDESLGNSTVVVAMAAFLTSGQP